MRNIPLWYTGFKWPLHFQVKIRFHFEILHKLTLSLLLLPRQRCHRLNEKLRSLCPSYFLSVQILLPLVLSWLQILWRILTRKGLYKHKRSENISIMISYCPHHINLQLQLRDNRITFPSQLTVSRSCKNAYCVLVLFSTGSCPVLRGQATVDWLPRRHCIAWLVDFRVSH